MQNYICGLGLSWLVKWPINKFVKTTIDIQTADNKSKVVRSKNEMAFLFRDRKLFFHFTIFLSVPTELVSTGYMFGGKYCLISLLVRQRYGRTLRWDFIII